MAIFFIVFIALDSHRNQRTSSAGILVDNFLQFSIKTYLVGTH